MRYVLAIFFVFTASTALLPAAQADVDSLLKAAREQKLSQSIEWRRLLHYERSFFGGSKSQADGENFFLAKDGRTNPEAELEATIRGFFSLEKRTLKGKDQVSQTIRCQFPARFQYLSRELKTSSDFPAQECSDYADFRKRVGAKSITLVFSSFYGSNPSSIYGHSLIRLNRADGTSASEQRELLDTGVNYAALQTTDNPILYALFGLSGVFEGHFSILPYFYKVREYADFESRDLWEYDLDLTPAEVDQITAHIWELASTYFDYFYLTENCSYHMLTLIEAGAPRLNLVDRVPYWVIPTDTVKAAFEAGAVRKTVFRPSVDTQFRARYAKLSPVEQNALAVLISEDRRTQRPAQVLPKDELSDNSRARVFDAYMDYIDLHYAKELYQKNLEYSAPKQNLLIARSRLPASEPLDFSTTPVASPHLSHGSARANAIAVSDLRHGKALEIGMRFALHDLLDPSRGLPKSADIDFFHIQMRYWQDLKALKLEKFTLFGVGSYAPVDQFETKSSWRLKVGAKRFDDARCLNCIGGSIEGGFGMSAHLLSKETLLAYAMGETSLDTSPSFDDDKFVARFGPTLGLRLRFSEAFALLTEARYLRAINGVLFDERILDSRLRWVPIGSSFGADFHGLWSSQRQEVGAGLVYYF